MLDHDAATRLRQQLGQLPELLVLAHLALTPGSTPRAGRVSGGAVEAPLPCRLDVLDLLAARHDSAPGPDQLVGWARLVIYDRRTANDWSGWLTVPVALAAEAFASLAVRLLLFHHEFAIRRDYARDYADEIGQLHRALNRTVGSPITARPVRIPCPKCRLLTMRQRDDGHRECSNPDCKAVRTESEYAEQAERAAAA